MPIAAIDNDILFKGLCYGLLRDFIAVIPSSIERVGILGAARFVITAKLRRARPSRDLGDLLRCLESFFGKAMILEPTNAEAKMAAEIEFAAQERNVGLDVGESQLCAIAISRNIPWIVTGDKRAVRALGVLVSQLPVLSNLIGRFICLEQLALALLVAGDAVRVRERVCGDVEVDRSLAICFSCLDCSARPEGWAEGLRSYIEDLRKSAANMLKA
jgi:hypothetical protein